MNERIKELAEQVYGSAHHDDFKFAELIVLKCLDVVDKEVRNRLAQPEQKLMIDCPRCGHCCPKSNQEPVVLMDAPLLLNGQPLYTTPPQRQWVGLTDEDRQELAAEQHSWEGLCSAVEAKLKEKNT